MDSAQDSGRAGSMDLGRAADLMRTDPAAAEVAARKLLEIDPNLPEVQLVLATSLRLQGDKLGALAILEPLAAADTESWLIHGELGQVLFGLGRSRLAVEPLARAVALNPGWALGWRVLGDIRLFAGDFNDAQSADDRYLRAVVTAPPLRSAVAAIADGRLDDAETEMLALLAQHPNNAAIFHLIGEIMVRRNRLPEAERVLTDALQLAPDFDLARLTLTSVFDQMGKCVDALHHVELLLGKIPGSLRCRILKWSILTEMGDFAGVLEVLESLVEEIPDQPMGWLAYAGVLRIVGRTEQCIQAYHKALELKPGYTDVYSALAYLKAYTFTADERGAMEAMLAKPELEDKDRINLHFALGKVHEDGRDWDGAFAHFAQGNALEFVLRQRGGVSVGAIVERSKALFTPSFFAEREGWGTPASDPIFVVGMPRSGSTLIEQILSSHPSIEATRELMEVQLIADFLSDLNPDNYPDKLASAPRELMHKLGLDYLAWTLPFRRLGRVRFIDKSPINFLHIGLIKLMLPRAKIIDTRRHPLDCCFSAFKHNFNSGWEATYDLGHLGRLYSDYVDLMAHYDAVLPGFVHRVIYEELVSDTEAQVRALLSYLELPFDPACLSFFETKRAIATPSSEQVRKPISADAVGYWRNFDAHLGPLKAALGPVLDAYPPTA